MVPDAILVTLVGFALLILAYRFYGRFLAKRIFQLDPNRTTPAHSKKDGVDFVPTKTPVLFGHHFASIAGLGPILGPALAVIWGWLPAVLWVVVGSIFIGAVHDLGAVTVSLRYKGRSIGDVCRELIGPRARLLFLIIIFFAMSLAMGAFVNAISCLFINFNPDSIIPSFGLMVVAMIIGVAVYQFKVKLLPATIIGLVAFAGLIAWGETQPIPTYDWFVSAETQTALEKARESKLERPYGAAAAVNVMQKEGNYKAAEELRTALGTKTDFASLVASSVGFMGSPMGQGNLVAASSLYPEKGESKVMGPVQTTWIWVLLAYGFVASVLPVWLLLQPRDYINSFQLYFALAFLLVGLVVASVLGADASHIQAQAVRMPGIDFEMPGNILRPIVPFLFVTIACGAVSGFHSLVSSGTTVRQMNKETDALPIGYGAMLTEGALAILVIMACVAGLGISAWQSNGQYMSWTGASGRELSAVVAGGANFLSFLGIPTSFGGTFLAVTIVAFALTTLDSATRLLRFNVEEVFRSVGLNALSNRYLASLIAVCGIALFGLVPGSRTLWTLFGTTNQLLAGLTLLTVSIFLFKLSRPVVYTLLPMVLMLVVTIWAMIISLQGFWENGQWLLLLVAGGILVISLWLLVEAAMSFARGRGGLQFEDDKAEAEKEPAMAGS